jgi:hypothetical protein
MTEASTSPHYEEFPKNPLISALSGMCKVISLTLVHTVIHVTCNDDMLIIRVKFHSETCFYWLLRGYKSWLLKPCHSRCECIANERALLQLRRHDLDSTNVHTNVFPRDARHTPSPL